MPSYMFQRENLLKKHSCTYAYMCVHAWARTNTGILLLASLVIFVLEPQQATILKQQLLILSNTPKQDHLIT
jgi:hypothetical protein